MTASFLLRILKEDFMNRQSCRGIIVCTTDTVKEEVYICDFKRGYVVSDSLIVLLIEVL